MTGKDRERRSGVHTPLPECATGLGGRVGLVLSDPALVIVRGWHDVTRGTSMPSREATLDLPPREDTQAILSNDKGSVPKKKVASSQGAKPGGGTAATGGADVIFSSPPPPYPAE